MRTDSYRTADSVPHYIPLDLLDENQESRLFGFLRL
jgi:hypothetical protein